MRRKKAWNRRCAGVAVVAGGIGCLLCGWQVAKSHNPAAGLSPAQTVALRFPEVGNGALASDFQMPAPTAAEGTTGRMLGDAQAFLLSPAPMMPNDPQQPAMQEPIGSASPLLMTTPQQGMSGVRPAVQANVTGDPARRLGNRPGFVLNDAQIASIKQRLHLTPQQERLWPAVEAALRNLAYVKARKAHRGGTAAGTTAITFANPNNARVQDLKSAAVPLIMSFTTEQKNQVRSLAHVMGLDRLASEL